MAPHTDPIEQQNAVGLTAALNGERMQRSVMRRAWMVRRLGVPGNSAAIAPLSLVLEIDPDDDVRGLAAIALGRIGDPLGAPALRKALEEPYWPCQVSAILSLWLLRDPGSIPRFSERLRYSDSTLIREFTAHALGDIGDRDTVPVLIEALSDPIAGVRKAAAGSLGALGDARALEPLRLARESARWPSRRRVDRALDKLEGHLRPTWRARVFSTDRLIAIEMNVMVSFLLASSVSKTMRVRGEEQRKLAAAIGRGRRLFSTGRKREALDFLERAVEQFPEDAEIRWLYAASLWVFRPDEVAEQAAKAVALAPGDPSILVRAGILLLGREQFEEARYCAARANELAQPDFLLMPGLMNLDGCLADLAGEDDRAEEKLRRAVAEDPDNAPFAIDLARFLDDRDRQPEAVDVIDEALKKARGEMAWHSYAMRFWANERACRE